MRIVCRLFLACICLSMCVYCRAQETSLLLRQPDVSRERIVFVYGGDLWTVPRAGGAARRLTANPSVKRYPKFSPDGKWIAFTGNYDGNTDVYVIPTEGGEPKRLTYHPGSDLVLGWTPDGKSILFRSTRYSIHPRVDQLFTVPFTGGLEVQLPIPEAGLASYSPDGTRVAYNRFEHEFATWKRYRGGWQHYVSIYDLKANKYSELPHTAANDGFPMWKGERIYMASDRPGVINLFSYDLKTRALKQLTHFKDFDVKWPSLGPDSIVFEQGGAIKLFDLQNEQVRAVPIQVHSDLAAARPSLRRVEGLIGGGDISPSGARAVLEARGEIFTVPAKKGDTRDITNTPGIREVSPAWSPDGKRIAYFSDRSGEYELYVRPQDGSGEEIRLTNDGHIWRNGPVWSPDSKALCYTDEAQNIWMVTIADKKPILIENSKLGRLGMGKWSPDSKWIAYAHMLKSGLNQIVLYSADDRKSHSLGNGRFDDHDPVFDPNGKYLYFLSDRTFAPTIIGPELGINFLKTARIYALALRSDGVSPTAPESDEEKPAEAAKTEGAKPEAAKPDASKPSGEPTRIDLEGLYNRMVVLPPPAGAYQSLTTAPGKVYYLSSAPGEPNGSLHQLDLNSRADVTIISGIDGYDLSTKGTKIGYRAGPTYGIIDPTPNQSVGAGALTLALEMRTDPRAEWEQMFREAWRYDRDYYYDPNIKGLGWKEVYERYLPLVKQAAHRDDLTYLLQELQGELATSHAYVGGGEAPEVRRVGVGLLGAQFEQADQYYRIKRILPGRNWNPAYRSPLTDLGVDVKQGDYILAINGVPLRAPTNPYQLLEGTTGKTIVLRVNSRPAEEGARDVKVRPIESETPLLMLEWIEANRKRVEEASNGKIGYVYLPNTQNEGMEAFGEMFYSQLEKDALVVDERYNGGGYVPSFFIERLDRKPLYYSTARYAKDYPWPNEQVVGPKAMLTNEYAGSGGDSLPYFFRKAGVGPVIGKRTWGGLVGISRQVTLMDGGNITVPEVGFWSAEDNRWVAENHGVDPDIEVNNTPDLVNKGRDPQLEKAIEYLQEAMKKGSQKKPEHPPFPVEKLPAP